MKWKMSDDAKSIVVDDQGLPVVITEDGKEFGIDGIHLYSKIPTLQEEAKTHRLKAKEYKEKLDNFSGIENPLEAIKALETIKHLKTSDLSKKEELDRLKTETEAAWKTKLENQEKSYAEVIKEKDNVISSLESDVYSTMISTHFAKSPYFTGKEKITNLTPDIAESHFGKHFKTEKFEDGSRAVVGYLKNKPIYSKKRPGEFADFEESLSVIIDAYPRKSEILQQSVGSGGPGNGGRTTPGGIIDGSNNDAFINNLESIAKGKMQVVKT